jgi:hypothetical protein
MEAKIKAKELVSKYYEEMQFSEFVNEIDASKQCAIIAVENEYHTLRELIFLLRSNGVIESEKTFLHFVDLYIKEEAEVKREIELL